MKNYYKFTKLIKDRESFRYFNFLSNKFYYSCISLSEELNDMKITFNILKDGSNNE